MKTKVHQHSRESRPGGQSRLHPSELFHRGKPADKVGEQGCSSKIVTEGGGKDAKSVVKHVCKQCGSEDASCCVMKKGAGPTPGMEGHKGQGNKH